MQDLIVIGGRPGGFAAAMRAAQLGGKVTIVEEAHYGGNCMNEACVPSKFLLTAARRMGSIRKAERFATGSVAAQLPIKGADLPGVIGTEEALQLRQVPARIVILSLSFCTPFDFAQGRCASATPNTLAEIPPSL